MSISLDMIFWIYKILFFILPFAFTPWNSELFEFNKIILIYTATVLVISIWGIESIKKKNFIFPIRKLDFFLGFFLFTQVISTILSIDPRTSFLGYYSRWNGGLLSIFSYAILYKAFSIFINRNQSVHLIKVLIFSSIITSIYAALEHFGYSPSCLLITRNFNIDCWVQDVQNRVFGTFGQPNWLAAWLVGILPLSWFSAISEKKVLNKLFYLVSSFVFVTVIYYTKSRSAALALSSVYLIFWISTIFLLKRKALSIFTFTTLYLILATIFISTPWQINLINKSTQNTSISISSNTVLENGGTESGEIRKIVWKGAYELFKKYPLFGSGVETFAYAYYQTRPIEHNLTSEWNFLYNKAHNEYLNYLATTGILGLSSYLILIFYILYLFTKKVICEKKLLYISLGSGFLSILITNFFGFSTAAVNILFFVFPAMALTSKTTKLRSVKNDSKQNLLMIFLGLVTLYMLYIIFKYWYADFLYAKSITESKSNNFSNAILLLENSVKYFPNEPIYTIQLAEYYAEISSTESSSLYLSKSLDYLSKSQEKILFNVKLLKQMVNIYSDLAKLDPYYLQEENKTIVNLAKLAPTDASIQYMYAVSLAKLGKVEDSVAQLEKVINMKPNYKLARKLLGYIYEDLGQVDKAREQYEYILKNIDPEDEVIKQDLENLKLKVN